MVPMLKSTMLESSMHSNKAVDMGEADKRGKEEMKKENVEQEEEGCKSNHCEQRRH